MFRFLTRWLRNRRLDATFDRLAPYWDPDYPRTQGTTPHKGLPPTEPDEGGPRRRRRDHGSPD